jgi:hypothetical protein
MKFTVSLTLVAALAVTSLANAEEQKKEIKSGLQTGDRAGAFYVTKVAGAEEDGVATGKNLCYRCRNGARPQVMIFTRSTDKNVLAFLKSLDEAITKNEDKQLRGFVNLLGEDKEELNATAKKFTADSKTKNIPFVVPNEFENGPDDYGINSKAEVTILLVKGLKVQANHSVAKASDLDAKAVVKDLDKILGK